MVREPGSSGASGFHRESQEQEEEEVSIKLEPRMDASSETGSPTTLLNETGPVDRQSTGRSSADRNKKDNLLEAKPQPLSMPPLEARRHDSHRDPPDEEPKVKLERIPSPTNTEDLEEEEVRDVAEKAQGSSRLGLRGP
ncbi:hypothetical protein PC110_g18259 [Phytophthora cactorum]|uniref:Uncharacterized protein n=1 Tax=Phytophthora cactorum TaxID=29920 RepID=A0A329RLS0_9STRA|nr:hypothetical protein PC110_g18259 [Phytophthora cactorum]